MFRRPPKADVKVAMSTPIAWCSIRFTHTLVWAMPAAGGFALHRVPQAVVRVAQAERLHEWPCGLPGPPGRGGGSPTCRRAR